MTISAATPQCGYESPTEDFFQSVSAPCLVNRRNDDLEKATSGYSPAPSPLPANLNSMVTKANKMKPEGKVSIRDRIACYQWTWFTMNMATGGVSNVLHAIPFRSRWLTGIGIAFFIFNLCLFVVNCVLITLRFRFRPGTFINSFTNQFESLFIPAFVVSIATILINTCEYGVPATGVWLLKTMEVLYWIYLCVSIFASAGMYLILWSTLIFPIHTMTPVWVFPAYPLLLTAPFAGTLISAASSTGELERMNRVPVALAAVAVQGTGFLLSYMILAAFLYRLMTQKLPRDMQRPGVFISIGPSGFTVAGIVQLGNQAKDILPLDFMGASDHAVFILKLTSSFIGLWLWGLSVWFFIVSVGSLWKYLRPESKMPFQMTWFSFVFPNTALVTATIQIGRAFESRPFEIVGCTMAACLIIVWALVFSVMIRCLWKRELLWPKDDD